jgi:hypothetical protein
MRWVSLLVQFNNKVVGWAACLPTLPSPALPGTETHLAEKHDFRYGYKLFCNLGKDW